MVDRTSARSNQLILWSRRFEGRRVDLATVPERFGFFIDERSFPPFGHREQPTHRPERRGPTSANRHELRDGSPMPLDHDLLAIFDEVEELRQLRFGAMHADVHDHNLVHFLD